MPDDSAILEVLDEPVITAVEVDGGESLELQIEEQVQVLSIAAEEAVDLYVGDLNASVYVTDDASTDPNIALLPPGTAIIEID